MVSSITQTDPTISVTVNYTYDKRGRLIAEVGQLWAGPGNSPIAVDTEFEYDQLGNRLSRTDNTTTPATVTGYEYDVHNFSTAGTYNHRLLSATTSESRYGRSGPAVAHENFNMTGLRESLTVAISTLAPLGDAASAPSGWAALEAALFRRHPALKDVLRKHYDRIRVDVEALVGAPDAAARWKIERKQIRDMLIVFREELTAELERQP
ncbi:MAG: hypothetical protein ACKVS9_09180 [Phycisphaerae bacterium]